MERDKALELIIKACVEVIVSSNQRARREAFAMLRELIDSDL